MEDKIAEKFVCGFEFIAKGNLNNHGRMARRHYLMLVLKLQKCQYFGRELKL